MVNKDPMLELWERAKRGNHKSLEEIRKKCEGMKIAIIKKCAPWSKETDSLYQDLIQEAWFAICEAIKTFNPRKGTKFTTWTWECIENRIKSKLKKEKKFSFTDVEEIQKMPDKKNNIEDQQYKKSLIEEYIKELTPREKEVFLLREEKGKKFSEIGKKIGTTATNAYLAYKRAKRVLKQLVKLRRKNVNAKRKDLRRKWKTQAYCLPRLRARPSYQRWLREWLKEQKLKNKKGTKNNG